MHVPASFSAFHLHSMSTRESSQEPLGHVTWSWSLASEMLLTHWCATLSSPLQHESASSAGCLTLLRDPNIIALLCGGRTNQLRLKRHWNVHLLRSFQRADVPHHGVNVLLLVPVGRPEHEELLHSFNTLFQSTSLEELLHSFMRC